MLSTLGCNPCACQVVARQEPMCVSVAMEELGARPGNYTCGGVPRLVLIWVLWKGMLVDMRVEWPWEKADSWLCM